MVSEQPHDDHTKRKCTQQMPKADGVQLMQNQGLLSCAGICPAGRITCLVVDECHRATGKADVVLAVKRMREAGVKFRVLGLSATPGRDRESVQVIPLISATRWVCFLHVFERDTR